MSNIVQVELVNLVSAWLGVASYTAPTTPMKLHLSTAATSSTSAGTPVSGDPSQTITFGTPTSATPSVSTNTGAVTFTAMPACTVTDINIYDNAGTPVRKAFGPLTASKTTASGDTLSFAIGAVSAQIG